MLHLKFKKQSTKLFTLLVCFIALLLPSNIFAENGFLRFKVNKQIGESVSIFIYTVEGMKDAKVNITGVENTDHFKSGKRLDYTLTSQEVTISGDIENIYIDNNNVTEVEAKDFTTLRKIECYNNEITSLDVTGCPNIYWIDCNSNLLTELKLVNFENLKSFFCEHNKITKIDIENCPVLWSFGIEDNLLDEKEMEKIVNSLVDRSEMNDFGSLHVEDPNGTNHNYFDKVLSAVLEGKKWKAYENVDNKWKRFYGKNVSDAVILYARKYIDDVMTLNIEADCNLKFYGIRNPEAFVNGQETDYVLSSPVVVVRGGIKKFAVNNMDITLVDVASNTTLEQLDCKENQVQILNITDCAKLTDLDCSYNEISEIDFTGTNNIKNLNCETNYIMKLNVSGCSQLTNLNCTNNILTTLDIKNCNNLHTLGCSANQLRWSSFNNIVTDINDLSESTEKGNIYVYDEMYEEERNRIDVEQVAKLTEKGWNVFCYKDSEWYDYAGETVMGPSKITIENDLNVGDVVFFGFIAMGEIKVSGVAEPEKAISGLVEMFTLTDKTVTIEGDIILLDCSMNDHSSIVLDNCQMLETLNCYDNHLTNIEFKNCPNVKEIHCYDNRLDGVAMTNMINTLPLRAIEDTAIIDVYDDVSGYDENVCLDEHVSAFYAKNWTPYYHEKDTYDWVAYENTHVGIENAIVNGKNVMVRVNGDMISVENLPAATMVRVIALDGSCVKQVMSDANGFVHFANDMARGIYMINAGKSSVKMIIR